MSRRSSSLSELQGLARRYAQAAEHHRAAAEVQHRHGKIRQAEDAAYRAQMAELWHEKVQAEIEAHEDAQLPPLTLEELQAECHRLKLQVANLQIALQSNRRISMAVGILMSRHGLTSNQAFDRLRAVSQNAHRKLHEVADAVIYAGDLPEELRPRDA